MPLQFQPTHPVRGATVHEVYRQQHPVISTHAPREGCDVGPTTVVSILVNFNPRTPRGVRPAKSPNIWRERHISIHAPREGCDWKNATGRSKTLRFQSTHPVRGATSFVCSACILFVFQPTHPVRGATRWMLGYIRTLSISTHAPREGCDCTSVRPLRLFGISTHAPREGCDQGDNQVRPDHRHFNPRTP